MKNKIKSKIKPFIIVGIILIVLVLLIIILRGPEDTWIMDERGVWVMHGNPAITPDYVKNQQTALSCVTDLYNIQKIRGIGSNYECLGSCYDYAVDIIHVPRVSSDDIPSNECLSYLNGTLSHFIEIDGNGTIVRVK